MYNSYDEIFSQGDILKETYEEISANSDRIKDFFNVDNYDYEEIVFVACGSSYWLSMSACMTFQEKLGKRCFAVKSGDVVMNTDYYLNAYKKPLLIAPSRSGNTSETLMALKSLRDHYRCRILCMVEDKEASIINLCDLVLEFPWAFEVSVCQTRSFSNLYMASVMVAALAGGDDSLLKDLRRYIDDFDRISGNAENLLGRIIRDFPQCDKLITLGNGKIYGVSIEGAYIAIEMALLPSNYYGTLEFRHGPVVMADPAYLVVFFSGGNGRKYEEDMALDVRRKGSKIIAISSGDDFINADYRFNIGREAAPEVVALYGIMVMQGFAHLKAVDLGRDPDSPGDLVQWIKL